MSWYLTILLCLFTIFFSESSFSQGLADFCSRTDFSDQQYLCIENKSYKLPAKVNELSQLSAGVSGELFKQELKEYVVKHLLAKKQKVLKKFPQLLGEYPPKIKWSSDKKNRKGTLEKRYRPFYAPTRYTTALKNINKKKWSLKYVKIPLQKDIKRCFTKDKKLDNFAKKLDFELQAIVSGKSIVGTLKNQEHIDNHKDVLRVQQFMEEKKAYLNSKKRLKQRLRMLRSRRGNNLKQKIKKEIAQADESFRLLSKNYLALAQQKPHLFAYTTKKMGLYPVVDLSISNYSSQYLKLLETRKDKTSIQSISKELDNLEVKASIEYIEKIDKQLSQLCSNDGEDLLLAPNIVNIVLAKKIKNLDYKKAQEVINNAIPGYCHSLKKIKNKKKLYNYVLMAGTGVLLLGSLAFFPPVALAVTGMSAGTLSITSLVVGGSLTGVAHTGKIATSLRQYNQNVVLYESGLESTKIMGESFEGLRSDVILSGAEFIPGAALSLKIAKGMQYSGKNKALESSGIREPAEPIKTKSNVSFVNFKQKKVIGSKTAKDTLAFNQQLSGLTGNAINSFKNISKSSGYNIYIRKSSPHSIKLRNQGHPPKFEELKMKSANEIDVYLGVSRKNLGAVVYYKPTLPKRTAGMSKVLYAKIKSRYHARLSEFADNKSAVAEMTLGKNKNKFNIKIVDGVVIDKKTNKSYTSDYDLFQITKKGGESLSKKEMDEVLAELAKPPTSIQHPAHIDWRPRFGRKKRAMYKKIIKGHKNEKNSLIKFTSDGNMEAVNID